MLRWLAITGFALTASLVAWIVTGRVLDDQAQRAVASAWVDAELCLVGPALGSGVRPSVRLRTIALGSDAANDWPRRCLGVSRVLDETLKAPALRSAYAGAPSLAVALAGSASERDASVDRLWSMLRALPLPAGTPSWSGATPEPTVVVLKRAGLEVLATGFSLDAIAVDWSSDDGAVRVFFPGDEPRFCRIDLDSVSPELRCLRLTEKLPNPPRTPWQETKAPEFMFGRVAGRVGFFDAAAGTRIWSPPTDEAEAVIGVSGEATVLQTEQAENANAPHHWRLVRLVPGSPQDSRLLDLPAASNALLFPEGVVWWKPEVGRQMLYFFGIDSRRPPRRSTIGTWEAPKKVLVRCGLGEAHAVVGEGVKKRTVLIGSEKRFRLDELPLDGDLACFGGQVRTVRVVPGGLAVRRCGRLACADELLVGPVGENASVVPVGDGMVALVVDSSGIGRSLVVTSSGLRANPQVLFEDGAAGGLEVRSMRAIGGQKRGLLLLEDDEHRVYGLLFDANGDPTALASHPW